MSRVRGILLLSCDGKRQYFNKGYASRELKRFSGPIFTRSRAKIKGYSVLLEYFQRSGIGYRINKHTVLPNLYSKIEDFRKAKGWEKKAKKRA